MKKRKSSGNFIGIGLLCLLFLCVAVFSIFFVCCSKPSSDSSEETIPPETFSETDGISDNTAAQTESSVPPSEEVSTEQKEARNLTGLKLHPGALPVVSEESPETSVLEEEALAFSSIPVEERT